MKKIFAIILLSLFTSVAFAQSNYQDVVYLKNGSIIRGLIIEQIPNTSIKIETADKNVFVYQMTEIEKLAKETTAKKTVSNSYPELVPGYVGIIELGYQSGTGDYGLDRIKLNIINGYRINQNFSIGLGTGLRLYTQGSGALLVPVFADLRAKFLNNNISPYVSLGVGYSFDAAESFRGVGFLLNPELGVSFRTSKKSALNIGLGYEMQKVNFEVYDQYNAYWDKFSANSGALSFGIGVSF